MFKLNSLPKSIRIARDQPEFASLVATLDFMETMACGPDRSTTAAVQNIDFAMLVESEPRTQFVVVKLPDSAMPYVEQLIWSPPTYATYGRHLGQLRVCLAFEQAGAATSLLVDAHEYVDTLMDFEYGRAHLVLAIACGQMLYLRLLDDAILLGNPEENESDLHAPLFSADNYRPRREYTEEELQASVDELRANELLPYDPSLLEFAPLALVLTYD